MTGRTGRRGQPLVVLLALLGGWMAMRLAAWTVDVPDERIVPPVELAKRAEPGSDRWVVSVRPLRAAPSPMTSVHVPMPAFGTAPPRPRLPQPMEPLHSAERLIPRPPAAEAVPVGIAADHQLLWMAALASLPLPASVAARVAMPVRDVVARPSVWRDPRWSADGWLLLRRGGDAAPAAWLAPASYGASQAGAVIRYRLVPENAHRPSLYLRGSAALNGSREREAALGLSARPIAGLAVVVAAEGRVNGQPGATRVRPAAFAYTEFPPVDLAIGARAEFYGQAGYVGGNFASAFADGQLRVDRRVATLGRAELRAGGGAWGGAQKGAARLDVGPAATLGVPLEGSAGARLALDWRFRVAGNAAPSSGPALTLSAGF